MTGKDAIWLSIHSGVESLWHGGVMELRSLHTRRGTVSGFFDNTTLLADAAYDLDQQCVPAVYVTLNPVESSLFALAPNSVRNYAKETTQDQDILKRTKLLVDLDPKRKSGISATDEQHDATLERAEQVRADLVARGWDRPLFVDSGNGAHLIFPIAFPNDQEATSEVKAVLKALAARWDDDIVHVDQGVFNAARIVKLPGTMARKGASMPDRPHRRSRIIEFP